MAEQEEDLDLGEESGSGSKKKLIIIAAGAVLLLLIGLGAAWLLWGGDDEEGDASGEAATNSAEPLPVIYHPLNPVFVVNLPAGSKARMLQVGVQVMARDEASIEFIKHNDPMVRHNLLSLFGSKRDTVLRDSQGKQKLQTEVLKTINGIIKDQGGPGEIEAVFFTSFVMQ